MQPAPSTAASGTSNLPGPAPVKHTPTYTGGDFSHFWKALDAALPQSVVGLIELFVPLEDRAPQFVVAERFDELAYWQQSRSSRATGADDYSIHRYKFRETVRLINITTIP